MRNLFFCLIYYQKLHEKKQQTLYFKCYFTVYWNHVVNDNDRFDTFCNSVIIIWWKKNSVFKILYRLLHIKMSCNLMYFKIFVDTSLCNSNTSRLKWKRLHGNFEYNVQNTASCYHARNWRDFRASGCRKSHFKGTTPKNPHFGCFFFFALTVLLLHDTGPHPDHLT